MLSVSGHWFIDRNGRKVLLRGVNLGGSSKVPYPGGATHITTDFSDHRDISFINRPFSLEEAPQHFKRLRHWGFNCLRLLTTWEALEHEGPGRYDTDYLDFFDSIVEIAGEYGFYVFIDPHQDVWARMSGGDGAPGWTFEKVGLDFTRFDRSGAAKVMQYHYPEEYQPMEWSFNYYWFATATMFSLFFGSEDFAPRARIDGQSIQSYLQSHFIGAMTKLANKIKHHDHVIGFDSMNEPHPGYIGISDLSELPDLTPPGLVPTPFDTMVAGYGKPTEVPRYALKLLWLRKVGTGMLNPEGVANWMHNREDIWMQHGVWEMDGEIPRLLRPDHFKYTSEGRDIEFFRDYLRPFIIRYAHAIREVIPHTLIFVEGEPLDPKIHWKESDPTKVVNATHWYDGFTLYSKTYRRWMTFDIQNFRPVFLARNVRSLFRKQLERIKNVSSGIQGGIPTLIGEFGVPYDMHDKSAYTTGDFSKQISALSLYYELLDELQLHSTQWNYTSDNDNQWGDQWNLEDLSIYSEDQASDDSLDSGGRAIRGFCRVYPQRTSGDPIQWDFDPSSGEFNFSYNNQASVTAPTQIYLPPVYYNNGVIMTLSSDSPDIRSEIQLNVMKIWSDTDGIIRIKIRPR